MKPITAGVRPRRLLLACAALAALAACGSDDDPEDSTSTSTRAASSTTTVPIGVTTSSGGAATSTAATSGTTLAPTTATTSPPPTPTTAASVRSCGGRAALTEYLVRFATASSPIDDLKFVISDVAISSVRAEWGRGTATPPADSGLDGFVAVAHCEPKDGTIQWVVKDLGTSGVGCTPEVPADLAYDC